jgi:CubicO group peptidase (beta-lactamase class C family)
VPSARRGENRSICTLSMLVALAALALVPTARADTPPGGTVSDDPITAAQLLAGTAPEGLTRNARFARGADASAAHEPFLGSLHLSATAMTMLSDQPGGFQSTPIRGKDTTLFPSVTLSFFTYRGHLVPTTQQVVRSGVFPSTPSWWDVIVQPGRVWSQPGDRGWSRASFPFALVNSLENETHSGIALFLYKGDRVSHVRFQIVQETSPWYVLDYFSAWGVTSAEYTTGGIADVAKFQRRYARELARRLPVRRWWRLPASVRQSDVVKALVSHPREDADVYVAAAVRRGALYRSYCRTAAGWFPYCDEMRHGVWSVTKSAMMNVALLRLAQKFGRGILHEPIARYLVEARRPGWRDVTFLDMANMSSGHGHGGDEEDPDYSCWYEKLSEEAKTAEALASPREYEPGTAFNYRDRDAYLLGAAEDALLTEKQGADASIWRMLQREVYRPIGIFHAPTNSTVEPDGSRGQPLMAWGYYPTLDDLAKLGLLYQNGGAWNGRQILHRGLVETLLPTTDEPPADRSPDPGYYLNWWISQVEPWWVASMEGFGGNRVALLPRDLVGIQIGNEPYRPAPPWPIRDPCG